MGGPRVVGVEVEVVAGAEEGRVDLTGGGVALLRVRAGEEDFVGAGEGTGTGSGVVEGVGRAVDEAESGGASPDQVGTGGGSRPSSTLCRGVESQSEVLI